jgi:DNA-binding XRE family transcriptional regulator
MKELWKGGNRMKKITLGQLLKTFRVRKALTQAEMANLLDVDRITYWRIENGKGKTSLATLKKIAKSLDKDIEEITSYKGA